MRRWAGPWRWPPASADGVRRHAPGVSGVDVRSGKRLVFVGAVIGDQGRRWGRAVPVAEAAAMVMIVVIAAGLNAAGGDALVKAVTLRGMVVVIGWAGGAMVVVRMVVIRMDVVPVMRGVGGVYRPSRQREGHEHESRERERDLVGGGSLTHDTMIAAAPGACRRVASAGVVGREVTGGEQKESDLRRPNLRYIGRPASVRIQGRGFGPDPGSGWQRSVRIPAPSLTVSEQSHHIWSTVTHGTPRHHPGLPARGIRPHLRRLPVGANGHSPAADHLFVLQSNDGGGDASSRPAHRMPLLSQPEDLQSGRRCRGSGQPPTVTGRCGSRCRVATRSPSAAFCSMDNRSTKTALPTFDCSMPRSACGP